VETVGRRCLEHLLLANSFEERCVDRKTYHHLYYETNKEKWEKDREKRRLYQQEYYLKNIERLREKGRQYTKAYGYKNPVKVAEATERCRKQRGERNRHFIEAYKTFFGCRRCGECDPVVLDMHHRNQKEKEFTVSAWLWRASLLALAIELEKCDALCANCHRREHYKSGE
jgi:hypothetical protein